MRMLHQRDPQGVCCGCRPHPCAPCPIAFDFDDGDGYWRATRLGSNEDEEANDNLTEWLEQVSAGGAATGAYDGFSAERDFLLENLEYGDAFEIAWAIGTFDVSAQGETPAELADWDGGRTGTLRWSDGEESDLGVDASLSFTYWQVPDGEGGYQWRCAAVASGETDTIEHPEFGGLAT